MKWRKEFGDIRQLKNCLALLNTSLVLPFLLNTVQLMYGLIIYRSRRACRMLLLGKLKQSVDMKISIIKFTRQDVQIRAKMADNMKLSRSESYLNEH